MSIFTQFFVRVINGLNFLIPNDRLLPDGMTDKKAKQRG